MRILALTLAFWALQTFAVTRAPLVLRACLNNSDSIVTLSWNSVPDACGSFTKYVIYGNENAGPFAKVAEIPNRLITEHSFGINNLNNTRSYYITVLHLCDLADSAKSNTVAIDITKPPVLNLIRVSFDMSTQNIFAEWNANPAADTKGYRLYRSNGGINDSIGETYDTSYIVSTDPNNVFDVTHAAFDSCRLFSPISTPHRPAIISSTVDTCARTVTLNWSLYKGWSQIDSQALFISKNQGLFLHLQTFNGTAKSFIFSKFSLGDSFCFVLRSYTSKGTVYSNSNKLCIQTRAFVNPSYLYLSNITVLPDQSIDIQWITDSMQDVSSFDIWAGINGPTSGSKQNLAIPDQGGSYSWNDVKVNTDQDVHTYMIRALNVCQEELIRSQEANSILLTLNGQGSFNAYNNWDGGVLDYDIEISDLSGSTWNTSQTVASSGSYNLPDTSACLRIIAHENLNSYGLSMTSTSNVVCIEPDLQVYNPNTFVIGGKNNRFVVLGTGIDHNHSFYEIYTRWGERIVHNPTNKAWYGDYKGSIVMPGIYVYVIKVQGIKGEKQSLKGVLRVIQ